MFTTLKQKKFWPLILFFLTLLIVAIYSVTSEGETPYNYFIRLADAFLHGKYYLTESPLWLNELIPIGIGKFAVVYPPAPAIVTVPFVLLFGNFFQQQILSQLMGALAAFIWGLIAFRKSGKRLTSLWIFLLASLGNIVWFMSSNGSVWYTGQISAYLFITLTIYESLNGKKIHLLILYFSLAFLSRLQVVLTLPLVFYLNWNQLRELKKFFSFFLGLLFFGIIYCLYNYFRFGSLLETGYSKIPGVLSEPWFNKGIFNLSYIPNHLRIFFTSLPIFLPSFPFAIPSWGGLAIWITSPAFIYSFTSKKRGTLVVWVCIILIALVGFSHGSTGFTQFGYRFAVDFYPLILLLIVEAIATQRLKWHHWTLLTISILANTWGVLFINKFDFVGW